MTASSAPLREALATQPPLFPTRWYSVLGVPVTVASDVAEVLECVDASYSAFRCAPDSSEATISLRLQQVGDGMAYVVRDAQGYERWWPEQQQALLDLLDHLVHALLAELRSRGIYAIHAGAVAYRGKALIVAGRSGQGKTTLVLGLLRRGLQLLSDEFAVIAQATPHILPYRRSLHIRPGTPELIPELRGLEQVPKHTLGGGNEWAVSPPELARMIPNCLAPAAPLRYVLLLAGTPNANGSPTITPVPTALAAMELMRGMWAASVDFEGALSRISRLLDGVVCARIQVGTLDPTLDQITAWLEAHGG